MAKRGENIYKRKDGRWEARFKPDGFGGYKYIYARTYKEAKEKLYELKAKARFLPDKKLTVAELCKEWLEYKNQDIKESTYIKYRNIITNYINPYFGSKCIGSLETADMQKFVFQLKNSGLSCKSIRDILSVTSSVIKYASKIGCCTSSLSLGELYPKAEKKPITLLSADERIRLERYLLGLKSPTGCGILLALYSGMRIGEICALKWENISLENETVTVAHTLQRLQDRENKGKTKIIISEPKSQSSKRIIPIPSYIVKYLKAVNPHKPSAFLLSGTDSLTEPKTLENRYKKCLKECGIPYINFHSLRHTFASRCVEVGFDVKSLSEILGHSSVGTTLNLYVHPTLEYKRSNMNKLNLFK